MKRKLIEVSRELLVIFMNHWVLALAALTVMGLFHGEKPYIVLWAALAVVPMIFYGVREKVQNFFLFFLLHFAVLALAVIAPIELLPKIFLVLIVLGYVIWSLRIRIVQEVKAVEQFHPIFVVLAIAVLSVVFHHFSEKEWQGFYVGALILYFLGYYIRYFLLDYEQFLIFNSTSASNLPERAIFYSGMRQTLTFTAGCMGVMLLIANVELLAKVGQWLKDGFLAVLRAILSLLPTEGGQAETTQTAPQRPASSESIMDVLPKGEAGKFWLILEDIMMAALAVTLVVVVVWAVVKGFQYLWKNFYVESHREYKAEDQVLDIRESCEIERGKNNVGKLFAFRDNREKVRKAYRSKVTKGKSTIVGNSPLKALEYFTAKECCEKIADKPLQEAYEKARYSELEITSEDVKLAKAARRA